VGSGLDTVSLVVRGKCGEWRSPAGQFLWETIVSLSALAETGSITGSIRFDSFEVTGP
jgi:hypothetical protein